MKKWQSGNLQVTAENDDRKKNEEERQQIYMQILEASHLSVFKLWVREQCVSQPKMPKNREKFTKKPLFLGFKVVQGHRCWYHWKARRQCLLW